MPELTLNLTATQQQLVGATLTLPSPERLLRFRLPAWTPGSYLIRDYVRHLERLEVWQGGRSLAVRTVAPAAWEVQATGHQPVEIRTQTLATELSVRTCHLNGQHGFLALAAIALQVEGERWSPHRLRLELPEGWEPFVPLPREADGCWIAPSFDALVDAPVEVGPHVSHSFAVLGVPHRWVSWETGQPLLELQPQWLEQVAAIGRTCCRFMGEEAPAAPDYLFVLHLLEEGYGGLEHDSSTVLQFGRKALGRPDGLRKLLQLVGHEYLHQWNVRRLRPAELTPIDYHQSAVVPSLWFAEGITSYVDQLLPFAAGLTDEAAALDDLGADFSRYLLTPGRHVQSLRQSSEQAWVKLYKRDAHSDDNQISYYLKGALLALVLDLHLRRGGSTLADVVRDLWRQFGRAGRGYSEADLIAAFARRSPELELLLPPWLGSTEDPPFAAYLADVGLELVPASAAHPDGGLVCQVESRQGLVVRKLRRDGPGVRSGLEVGDELLALDRRRLHQPDEFSAQLRAEQPQSLLVARRGQLIELTLTSAAAAIERWSLKPHPQAPAAAHERRRRWLALEPEDGSALESKPASGLSSRDVRC
ncbi:M61 family metallopeptidase [Cyanobium sp. Morenito 9A2]|uniref:M61 family metallopeptidase n=1 Tax=Cyanobium sp. Morenito 9A2 TaxID=2823718 RepID=UPI0020CDF422|nr:M61 family peptidase [Cyanobium sp. Morenito 9A2]MCP9850088.1 M61 family metallopeptidase [Cyanobium sp. Morenito 9A2]